MRIYGGNLLFAATDIVNFLGCRHAIYLDRLNLDQPAPVAEDDPYLVLLQETGLEHERRYLDRLRYEGRHVVEIEGTGSLEDRVARTRDAMAAGVDVIYQGVLLSGHWHGYADFLVRAPFPTRFGSYGYEPVDTKLSRSAKPKHVLQLCVYALLIGTEQGAMPPQLHVALGDGSTVSLPTSDFHYYFDLARERFEAFVTALPDNSAGQPCSHCAQCRWRDRCEADWESLDHLTFVANISRGQIAKLEARGATTMAGLAALPIGTRIPGMQPETLERLRSQAALQVARRTTGENRFELLPADAGRGFARLPRPSSGDLFFDMEGDPLFDGGLEYLFGFVSGLADAVVFSAYLGHDRAGEKAAFEQSVDLISRHLDEHPDAYVYHYGHYEEGALKRLAMLHGTREAEIDNLLRRHKLVDLYKVTREALRVSEPSYSIKNLEIFYMVRREDEIKTAGASIVFYEQWRRLRDGHLLQEIADYNEADCRSTLLLRDWLLTLRPAGTAWFDGAAAEAPDPSREAKRLDAERRALDTTARLLAGATNDRTLRVLVADLLEFHRREAKPEWWAMFHRQDLAEEELIDDAECIGGLRRNPTRPPQPIARSLVHSFTFPPQDFKLRVGDKPKRANTLAAAGEIVALDEEQRSVSLKIGVKAEPFEGAFSIIPSGPIDNAVLRDAVYRYADSLIASDGRYGAITSVLNRDVPRMLGRKSGDAVVPGGDDNVVDAAIAAISRLDASHMLVQGPPGAGKTFLSSRAIVELIVQGRRIGVASNSHKAINTLLTEISIEATKRGVIFRGAKKCSEDEHRSNSAMIADLFTNEEIAASPFNLVAGTAWLFARPEFDQAFDYLFVDEAGQVSLANMVAMGVSARNLVLVGDQMQLAQPIKGDHPRDSGLSVLDYVLGEHATVPPHRGVFLARTRRMHPDICRFISQAVYDSRLHADEQNAVQRLVLRTGADAALRPTGVSFVPVAHDDCSQRSEEEGLRVREIYDSLLQQDWINREGQNERITVKDILVVSPYNMQVNHLKAVLPQGALVGTVDKFQGQEAAVVLVSMATSSAEDMPRGMEFLFSRNRLNVAISRAKALAVVVANPRLFEAPCGRIEHMRLVNTLCFLRAYAEASARPA